ncbi:hypothetical protein ACFL6U_25140 [Planctomycetota bacterium]
MPEVKLRVLSEERERIFSLEKIDAWLALRKEGKTDQYKAMMKAMSGEFNATVRKHLNASEQKRLSNAKK